MNLTPHIKHVVLALIIAATLLFGVWKVSAHLEGVNHDQVVLDKAKIDADLEKAKIQASQTNVDSIALQTQLSILTASNADLKANVLNLRAQLDMQRKKDDTLQPDDLLGRWATLLGTSPTEFKADSGGIKASLTASHATVDALEQIPVLQDEADKAAANSTEKDKTIGKQAQVITDTNNELVTAKKTIGDNIDKCTAEKKELKDKQAKRNVFVAVVGFLLGVVFKAKAI